MHDQGRIISFGPFASRPLPLTLRAFTLIELLVVVAIIALLVAILLPSLNLAREQAKRTVCASHMKQMAISFHMYQYDFTLLPHSVVSRDPSAGYPLGLTGLSGGLYAMNGEVGLALMNDYGMSNEKLWTCPSNLIVKPRLFVPHAAGVGAAGGPPGHFYGENYSVLTYLDGSVWPTLHQLKNGAKSATHANEADGAMIGEATYNFQGMFNANHVSRGRGSNWILLDDPIVDGWNLAYGDGHVEWIAKYPEDQKFLFHPMKRSYGPTWFYSIW